MCYRTRVFLFALLVASSFGTPHALSQVIADSVLASVNQLPAQQRTERLVAGARKEGLIEFYGSLPFTDSMPLIQRFRKHHPFIKVKYTRGGGTSLVNRVLTEHKAGRHGVDVLGARGVLHSTLMKAEMVAKNMAPLRKQIRKRFKDDEGYLASPFTNALALGYNKMAVPSDQAPQSYHDLLDPRWRGQIALDREAYDWLAGILDIMGEEKGFEFARKLAAQNLTLRRGHTLMPQLMAAGEVQVMVEAYHFRLQMFMGMGAPVDFVLPNPTILKDPSGIWIARRAPHPHAAALLVDFLFSREGQQVYASQNRLVARKDMEWDFKGKKVPGIHIISSKKWGPRYNQLIKQFDEIFRKGLNDNPFPG